jgi:hypothetical protein
MGCCALALFSLLRFPMGAGLRPAPRLLRCSLRSGVQREAAVWGTGE